MSPQQKQNLIDSAVDRVIRLAREDATRQHVNSARYLIACEFNKVGRAYADEAKDAKEFEAFVQRFGDYRKAFEQTRTVEAKRKNGV